MQNRKRQQKLGLRAQRDASCKAKKWAPEGHGFSEKIIVLEMGHSSERREVPASPPWTHPASGKTLPKYFISLPSVHSFYKNWPDILLYIPSTVQGALGLKRWKYSVFLLWNSSWRREMRQEETEREWVLSSSELHYNLCTIKKEQGAVTEVTCLPGPIRRMSFTVPQFPHLQNRDNNRTFLKGLERGING